MPSWGVVEELTDVVLPMLTEAVVEPSDVDVPSVDATLVVDCAMSSSVSSSSFSWVVDSINVELADSDDVVDDVVDDVDSGAEVPSGDTAIVEELLGASRSMNVVVASDKLSALSSGTVVVSPGMDVSPDPSVVSSSGVVEFEFISSAALVVSYGSVVFADTVVSSEEVSSGCVVVELAVELGDSDVDSFWPAVVVVEIAVVVVSSVPLGASLSCTVVVLLVVCSSSSEVLATSMLVVEVVDPPLSPGFSEEVDGEVEVVFGIAEPGAHGNGQRSRFALCNKVWNSSNDESLVKFGYFSG